MDQFSETDTTSRSFRRRFAIALLILCVGGLLSFQSLRLAAHNRQDALLQQARILAETLSLQPMAQATERERLQAQLAALKPLLPEVAALQIWRWHSRQQTLELLLQTAAPPTGLAERLRQLHKAPRPVLLPGPDRVLTACVPLLAAETRFVCLTHTEDSRSPLLRPEREGLPLLQALFESLLLRAQQKGLQLSWQLAPELPTAFYGDAGRLRQVLSNLIDNALKFTEAGSVSLQVSLVQQSEQACRLHFAVRDTGPGIPEDQQSLLFQLFSQLDSSLTRQHGGTGLGLAICRQLVTAMGGDIGVDSQPGQGACFWFWLDLPLARAEDLPQERLAQAEAEQYPQLQGRVLLVEDNPINQQVALSLLQRFGLQLVLAEDGQQALDKLAQHPFDLVLMDVQMPVLDGESATRQLRAGAAGSLNQQVPVVALTAHALETDRSQCLAAGMNDYLSKPVQIPELRALLLRWLPLLTPSGHSQSSDAL